MGNRSSRNKRRSQQQKQNKTSNVSKNVQVSVEIDYDKLAEAIVKAQQKAAEPKDVEKTPKFSAKLFLKRIWQILANRVDTHGNLTLGTFALMIGAIFKAISIIGFAATVIGVIAILKFGCDLEWHGLNITWNVIGIALFLLADFVVFTYSVMFWGAANEIDKERDKNYIVSVFSGIVGFVALIVSLVALLKGGA